MSCTTILVGKKATNDGSTLISRNNDGPFRPRGIIANLPSAQPRTYTSVIARLTMELPENPLRYNSTPSYQSENGIWPCSGINEANVAMTATETITSNPRVLGADPYVEYLEKGAADGSDIPGGIGEEDLVTIVLPYIRSAREGVLRTGMLLEKYGTYEANGMAFSDKDEVWWLETIGGHHWIARRVPDDRVVIMPNQFGLDNFDFEDAYGAQKENICSADLKAFVEENHLYTGLDTQPFNPRLAFGSRTDADHVYDTPRSWFMARYFLERTYDWDSPNADFTPQSNDIPWSFVPERKVTVEDVRYLLGSYYQGTPYDPYDDTSAQKGKYRAVGVPNSDVSAIQQIRGYLPEPIRGVEWLTLGGTGFTACVPVYTNVNEFPAYLSGATDRVSTEKLYWQSRLIAILTDANYRSAKIFSERYQKAVANRSRQFLTEYDRKVAEGADPAVLTEANEKIAAMAQEEADKALKALVGNASSRMRTKYDRGDN